MTHSVFQQNTARAADKAVTLAKAVWQSPVCRLHRFFYSATGDITREVLKPEKKGVRKGFAFQSCLAAGAGLALAGTFVYGAVLVGGSALLIAGGYLLAADVIGAGVFAALGVASLLLFNIATAMGAGAMKASLGGLQTYYGGNAEAIISTRPPEELAEARAWHMNRLEAAAEFKAAAERPETGTDVVAMKPLVLRRDDEASAGLPKTQQYQRDRL
jgi:hypothetical protein